MRIVVANTKGGSGKTTLSTHLAAAWARARRDVALLDLDRQQCATAWLHRRPVGAPRIHAEEPDAGARVLKRYHAVVIDAPAGVKRDRVEELVEDADFVVVPTMGSAFDETATARFLGRLYGLKPVRKGRCRVLTVGVRVRPGTRAAADLSRFLDAVGRSLDVPGQASALAPTALLRESAAYAQAARQGLAVFELSARLRGVAANDWMPLLSALGVTAGP